METTLKSLVVNFFRSSDCESKVSLTEVNLITSDITKFVASITLKFFFFLKIFIASPSKPFAITTSKNILFNSIAIFLFILKLQDTIPPKALIGSHASAIL